MKIAVHQMTSGIEPSRNVAVIDAAIADSVRGGAVMYFAPEMSFLIDRDRERARQHIALQSQTTGLVQLCASAARYGIWLHLGSIAVLHENGERLANRTLVIGADGTIKAQYDKMHLFDVDLASGESWRESSTYVGGEQPVLVQTPLGPMGLAICYDMRFPDMFSAYAKAGVDVITLPSAFTVPTGEAHWHNLLRTRAIETESFVIAAAQCGHHDDGRNTFGHSLVVDPWGTVLLDMGMSPGLAFVDLDLSKINDVRSQIPVHRNRRAIPPIFMAN